MGMHGSQKLGMDLFCGIGGISLGMKRAGIKPVVAVDSWDAAVNVYQQNFPDSEAIIGDITSSKLQKQLLTKWKNKLFLVAGGVPCQAFSLANLNRTGSTLPLEFFKLALKLEPEVILMEEVPPVLSYNEMMSDIYCQLKKAGYNYTAKVINAADFGVAQNRKRAIVLASRNHDNVQKVLDELPKRSHVPAKDVLDTPNIQNRLSETTQLRFHEEHKWKNAYIIFDENKPARTVHGHFSKPNMYPSRLYRGHLYRVSIDDALKLQGLPKYFIRNASETNMVRQNMIGNAVPPQIITKIMKSIDR